MNRSPISSSNLVSVGYDENTRTLEVEFKGGSVYQYFDVPRTVLDELINSGSAGSYFASNIKNSYRYSRL